MDLGVGVSQDRYPPLESYAFIGDCHAVALVSEAGSIDWLCIPRVDSPSVFGRLLDWDRGGFFSIFPTGPNVRMERDYRDHSLVLETIYRTPSGSARVIDFFAMRRGGRERPYRTLARIIEGIDGEVQFQVNVCARLEYGLVRPWIRETPSGVFTAVGGASGLAVSGDLPLQRAGRHDLESQVTVTGGGRLRVALTWRPPETLGSGAGVDPCEIDAMLEATDTWWRAWLGKSTVASCEDTGRIVRSGAVLRGLVNAPTGAIAAAPTTSLPEAMGGERNWDYRFSWIRDSVFAVRALTRLGMTGEADRFRKFVERSTAGNVDDLQVVYGVGGELRLHEFTLDELEGYRGSRPVRVGNAAYHQMQLDNFGHVLDLSWRWAQRGQKPDDDYWEFIEGVAGAICDRWRSPDKGMWEVRGEPVHFVHSKVMCWAGLDAAVRIAEATGRHTDPRWKAERETLREGILEHGLSHDRRHFVRAFEADSVDAALLLLPTTGFVAWDDPLMIRTVDAIRQTLEPAPGFLLRYQDPDGLKGGESAFLACSFWLAEALAMQGRMAEAEEVFGAAESVASPLGLFAEEYDWRSGSMTGNYPQGLTHLAHINAGLALLEHGR